MEVYVLTRIVQEPNSDPYSMVIGIFKSLNETQDCMEKQYHAIIKDIEDCGDEISEAELYDYDAYIRTDIDYHRFDITIYNLDI